MTERRSTMPHETLDILVAPGTTPLGGEVCRLGRAAGHEMTSLSGEGRPESEEPWIHGVAWSTGEATEPDALVDAVEGQSAVVLLPPSADANRPAVGGMELRRVLIACEQSDVERVVYATVGHQVSEARTDDETLVIDGDEEMAGGHVVLRLPSVEEDAAVVEGAEAISGDRRCPPVSVGQAAMAVLRAAAEPGHTGEIGCRDAVALGYAVMIQQ